MIYIIAVKFAKLIKINNFIPLKSCIKTNPAEYD
jgi:hypothetical protein